jgi:hypothetical protein
VRDGNRPEIKKTGDRFYWEECPKSVTSEDLMWTLLFACHREPAPVDAPTYHRDVAPIYASSCVKCHQQGGIAPFRLDDVSTAQQWASASALAVEQRTMPPFLVTGDGSCGDWADNEWLTDSEIATIRAWADAGAQAGDPADAPSMEVSLPELASVGLTAQIPAYVPVGAPQDDYRCFLVPNDSPSEQWLTGYEGVPALPGIVHHVAVYTVDPAAESYVPGLANGDLLAGLEAADELDGWTCFGAAGEGVRHSGTPATWAPGQGAVLYPEGSGYRLRPGHDLVVQVHYNLSDPSWTGEPDTTRVDFSTAPQVARELWASPADEFLTSYILSQYGMGESERIPAGDPAYRYSFAYTGAQMLLDGGFDPEEPRAFELVGVMPHMHERGSQEWVAVDGACAMEVADWDFHWQRVYFWERGYPMDSGSLVEVTCEWDASDASEDVMPGWGTDSEMCLANLLFTTEL